MSDWPEIIKTAIARSLDQVQTSCPAIVKSYDNLLGTVSIDLVVEHDPKIPTIADVPLWVNGGGGSFLHFPIVAGNAGLAIFSSRDFSGWRLSGKVSKASILQQHGLYAIFLPGLRPDFSPLNVAGISGAVLGSNAGPALVVGSKVSARKVPNVSALCSPLVRSDVFTLWASAIEGMIDGLVPGAGSTLSAIRSPPAPAPGIATTAIESD